MYRSAFFALLIGSSLSFSLAQQGAPARVSAGSAAAAAVTAATGIEWSVAETSPRSGLAMYLARPYPPPPTGPSELGRAPITAVDEQAAKAVAESVALDFLLSAKAEFGVVSADDLVIDHTYIYEYPEEYAERGMDAAVKYVQTSDGIPVLGSFHLVVMTGYGDVYIAKNNSYPDLVSLTTPAITEAEAVAFAQAYFTSQTPPRQEPRLAIYPQDDVGLLVWEMSFDGNIQKDVLVDAIDGTIVREQPNTVSDGRLAGFVVNEYPGGGQLGMKGAWVRVYDGTNYVNIYAPEDGYYDTGHTIPVGTDIYLQSRLEGAKVVVKDAARSDEIIFKRYGPWTMPDSGTWYWDHIYSSDGDPTGYDEFEGGQLMREMQRAYEYAGLQGFWNPNICYGRVRCGGGPSCSGTTLHFPDGRAVLDNGPPDSTASIDDVIGHEYGHAIQYAGLGGHFSIWSCEGHLGAEACGADCTGDDCNNHGSDSNACTCDALAEGWAHFFSVGMYNSYNPADTSVGTTGGPGIHDLELNTFGGALGANDAGEFWEGCVAATMWDIFDSNDDTGDTISLGMNEVLHVMVVTDAYTVEEFYTDFLCTYPEYSQEVQDIFRAHNIFFECNLVPYNPAGWYDEAVPRTTNDSTSTYAPLPSSLPGNSLSTYWNCAMANMGPFTAPRSFTDLFLDDKPFYFGWFGNCMGSGAVGCFINFGPTTVLGGRHTLRETVDGSAVVEESSEADNNAYHAYVWSPYNLTEDYAVTCPRPPKKDPQGYYYYSCDGFTGTMAPDEYWQAFAIMPEYETADYDIRLHDDTCSSTTGFGESLVLSAYIAGATDFVMANRNLAISVYAYNAGVLRWDEAASGDFKVERDCDEDTLWPGTGVGTETGSTDLYEDIIDIHEVYLYTGSTQFLLDCEYGWADLAMALFDDDDPDGYYARVSSIWEANSVSGYGDESYTYNVPDSGYYGVAIFKPTCDAYNLSVTYKLKIGQDYTPPTPDPMTFSTEPYEISTSSISMDASTASDPSTPVEYYFDFYDSPTGGTGGTDSGWQTDTEYTDTELETNEDYGYRVKARDSSVFANQTAYSSVSYDYTDIEMPTGITFGEILPDAIQLRSTNTPSNLASGSSGLILYNTTAGTNSGWKQDNDYWTSTGLSPNSLYEFEAKARNGDADETRFSPMSQKYTAANAPGAAAFGTIGLSSIRCNWTANGNPPGTEFRGYCSTTATHSGWTADGTTWQHTGLSANTPYAFYAQARNYDLETTAYASLGTRYTLANAPVGMTHSPAGQGTTSMRWEWASGGVEKDFYAWTDTPAADSGWTASAYWVQDGLSANTFYTAYAKARNGDDVETGSISHTAYTSIETPMGVEFGAITASSIAARSANTPSNLTSGSSATIVLNATEGTESGWRQNNDWWTSSGLETNLSYTFDVYHRNGDGDATSGASGTRFTLALVPGAPLTGHATSTTMEVSLDRGTNAAHTELALYNGTDGYYVDDLGDDNGSTPVWQTEAEWGTVLVSGLLPDADYDFVCKACNGDGVETGWSGVGSGHTRKAVAFVDNTPPPGAKGTGDSWLNPFLTIQEGVAVADEVWVAAGTYEESVIMAEGCSVYGGFAGTEGSRGERDWVANLTVVIGLDAPVFLFDYLNYAHVSGLMAETWGADSTFQVNGGHAEITENVITGYCGISATDNGMYVANNLITDCAGSGVLLTMPLGALLFNNTIVGSEQSGVVIEGGGAYLVNNVIVGNNTNGSPDCGGVEVISPQELWTYSNDVWGNLNADYVGISDQTGIDGNISADPEFAGASDYHLTEDSPCIDAGYDFGLPAMDWEGEPRVLDGDGDGTPVVDIGADEYYGAISVTTPTGWLTLGWNLISIPNDPLDPEGTAVFADIVPPNYLETNLFKYIPIQGYKEYGLDFTAMETCVGYWLRLTSGGECTYEAWPVKDEVRIPMVLGWNLIGVPCNEDLPAADVLVTDGVDTYSLADVGGHGWMQVPLYYYTNVSGYLEMGPAGPDDDHFRRWYGYWVLTWVPGLELVVPAP